MSGVKSDVQEQMRVRYPNVIYIYCWAHRLNLVLVNTCTDTPGGNEFYNTLQSAYNFFSHLLFTIENLLTRIKSLILKKVVHMKFKVYLTQAGAQDL